MKPFITYIGSKQKFMSKIDNLLPEHINNYYEPFVGGGSVFFYINEHYDVNKNYINDLDSDLINIYKVIKKNPDELIEELKILNKLKSKSQYEKIVKYFNENKSDKIKYAANYIFISKKSYNGKLNYNEKRGNIKPNYSFDKIKTQIYVKDNIYDCSELLNSTKISNYDYNEFFNKNKPKKGDFVFIDPPYLVNNAVYYYKNAFNINDFERLKKTCDKLSKQKINFMVTLNKHKELQKLFNQYNIKCFKKYSALSRGINKEYEMIITNY